MQPKVNYSKEKKKAKGFNISKKSKDAFKKL